MHTLFRSQVLSIELRDVLTVSGDDEAKVHESGRDNLLRCKVKQLICYSTSL